MSNSPATRTQRRRSSVLGAEAALAEGFEEGEPGRDEAESQPSSFFEPGHVGAPSGPGEGPGEGGSRTDPPAAAGFFDPAGAAPTNGGSLTALFLGEVVLPIRLALSVTTVDGGAGLGAAPAATPAGEAFKRPYVDSDYSGRTGFDSAFLGADVPLPRITDESVVSTMEDGGFVIPYEHFSIVMHKKRRLCLFTASNLHGAPKKKRPEPGRDYSRDGLSGLGKNDQEQWFTDPRIPAQHQLPDRFFTRDGKAFDKGHVVRREDVCWGSTYQQIRVANGDTFHTTNCTPQVAGFNQSSLDGRWGELENFIASQAKTEKLSLLAGPVLAQEDRLFEGVDDRGAVRIQIPRRYWKVVLAASGGRLRAFGFLLEQDLSNVPLEFAVGAEWKSELIALRDLEEILGLVEFPAELHDADQYQSELGRALVERTHVARRS